MSSKTKIEWCDSTWNPVTGCLHGCEYCYARKMAERYKGGGYGKEAGLFIAKYKNEAFQPPYVLNDPQFAKTKADWYRQAPYPFGFAPTFHRYRLGEPKQWKRSKPRTIFVCSMADLFGDWVSDEWIAEVFKACKAAPMHRYLFLTKNPTRYDILHSSGRLPHEFWYGTTVTESGGTYFSHSEYLSFLSIEPLIRPIEFDRRPQQVMPDWVIVGAETGNRKGKIVPDEGWVFDIYAKCRDAGVPLLMKNSLLPIVGEENMIREFPWEEKP